jgi:16S rRNA (uracil1498-N3)-methyltransferase
MDYIVEKATELGVERVIPLVSERTIVRPDDAGRQKKVARWNKIAAEAAKQCGRIDVPEVQEVSRYEDVIKGLDDYDLVLFAHLYEKTVPMKEAIKDLKSGRIIVFIGPEGDFTPNEVKALKDRGNCKFISLGKRVLKSDTAGLFVLAALNYEFSL